MTCRPCPIYAQGLLDPGEFHAGGDNAGLRRPERKQGRWNTDRWVKIPPCCVQYLQSVGLEMSCQCPCDCAHRRRHVAHHSTRCRQWRKVSQRKIVFFDSAYLSEESTSGMKQRSSVTASARATNATHRDGPRVESTSQKIEWQLFLVRFSYVELGLGRGAPLLPFCLFLRPFPGATVGLVWVGVIGLVGRRGFSSRQELPVMRFNSLRSV